MSSPIDKIFSRNKDVKKRETNVETEEEILLRSYGSQLRSVSLRQYNMKIHIPGTSAVLLDNSTTQRLIRTTQRGG